MNKFLKASFHCLLLCFLVTSTALFAPEEEEEEEGGTEPTNEPTENPWEKAFRMHEEEHQAPSKSTNPDKPLNGDDWLTNNESQPGTPTVSDVHLSLTETPNEKLQKNIESFDNASAGQPKITEALQALGLPTDGIELPTLDAIDDAYDAQIAKLNKTNPRFTERTTEGIQIKNGLDAIKKYLDNEVSTQAALKSFDIVNYEDAAAPKLNPKITTLDESFTDKLSAEEINTINTKYEALTTPEQKEAFLDNLKTLSTNEYLDPDNIIQEAYDDALKTTKPKEQSLTSKLWNTAERFWSKTFKSEKTYVKTIIKQALNGDATSITIIKSAEIKEYFKPLDLAQKKEILQTLQDEATKIGKNLSDIENVTPTDPTNLASVFLAGKKLEQILPKFTASVDELVDSFKPMCDAGQKIISVLDRRNFNLIINLVDFTKFTYDSSQSIEAQVDQLIQDQKLTIPEYFNPDKTTEIDSTMIFKQQLETEIESIADFQKSNTKIQDMDADKINANLYKFSRNQIAELTLNQITQISPENIIALNKININLVMKTLLPKSTDLLTTDSYTNSKEFFAKLTPEQFDTIFKKSSWLNNHIENFKTSGKARNINFNQILTPEQQTFVAIK